MPNSKYLCQCVRNNNRRPKSIHQYCAKGSPTNTLKALWCICIFLSFSLENKLFGIHQTSFSPVEALEFTELKTPLVYTFLAKTSFSAYLLVNILLKNRGKTALFDQKKHDQFWSSFFVVTSLSLFCLKMAKICCFCLSKRQNGRQKTRPPPLFSLRNKAPSPLVCGWMSTMDSG